MKDYAIRTSMLLSNVAISLSFAICAASAADPKQPIAAWSFDEGQGDIAKDNSGNGHDLALKGTAWQKQGDGFALRFNGVSAIAQCEATGGLDAKGPITVETWVNPVAPGWGECDLIGRGASEYLLNYSNRGLSWWLIATGSYNVGGKLNAGKWNHVVATFDGRARAMWINGQLVAKDTCDPPAGRPGKFAIGSESGPCFNGSVDAIRIYDRALSAAEAVEHYKGEAARYGIDPTWFQRIKLTPYYYLDRGEVIVAVDYRGMLPLAGNERLEVTLASQNEPKTPVQTKSIEKLPGVGSTEIPLGIANLAKGRYTIRATLRDDSGARPVEEVQFDYPPNPTIPLPSKKTAASVAAKNPPAPFQLKVAPSGGFRLETGGGSYSFQTRASWPNGEFNHLLADDKSTARGEKSWLPKVTKTSDTKYEIDARGDSYKLHREINVLPTHISVKDTYTNLTDKDLGLLVYNEMPLAKLQVAGSRIGGYEGGGHIVDAMAPHYGSPTIFIKDKYAGIGMLPMDDVYTVQSVMTIDDTIASLGTEKLAIGPGGSYSLQWAIYPTASGDYYDFINTFRTVEDRIGQVDFPLGYVSYSPLHRRQVPDRDFVAHRKLGCGIISCLMNPVDDPGISLEGIEFMDFPKERQRTAQQTAALKALYPGMKVVFHIAHTLYATNKPERFADSRMTNSEGTPLGSGGGPPYFSHERGKEGWLWHTFYPTPGNSFHDWMMKSVDVMMDEMGVDGAFVDGFLLGYGGRWTYDRWDGYSAEIDPKTKTITRKIGSVLLLMQPSMIEYSRRIRDKGGIVIANGAIVTPSLAKEKYILFDAECQAGPECHLAPTVLALGLPPFNNEKDIYLDILDKLRWGVLYVNYNERVAVTHPMLSSQQFPIKFEEIRPGMVRGKQRIVTMNSGSYGWPADRQLHRVTKFDGRGAPSPHEFITTVDADGARTQLSLADNESAVIERIPVNIEAPRSVNACVLNHDNRTTTLLVSGQGDATIEAFVGTDYPSKHDGVYRNDGGPHPLEVDAGASYVVTIGDRSLEIKERDGLLTVPVELNGQVKVSITRAKNLQGSSTAMSK